MMRLCAGSSRRSIPISRSPTGRRQQRPNPLHDTLGIAVEQGHKLPTGGYDVTHGTQIVAIDADDEGIAYWSEDVSSAQLAADLQHLLSE